MSDKEKNEQTISEEMDNINNEEITDSVQNEEEKEDTESDSNESEACQEENNEDKLEDENKQEKEENNKYEKEALEYRDKLIRKIAEFENYKKRTAKEYENLIATANADLFKSLLPVLDDIERFNSNYQKIIEEEQSDLQKALLLIFKKLQEVTKKYGLEQMSVINEEFDPNLHDALLQVEKENTDPGIVIEEYEKAYRLKDRIIRHAKVVVSK